VFLAFISIMEDYMKNYCKKPKQMAQEELDA
jgi:hypothetical protein